MVKLQFKFRSTQFLISKQNSLISSEEKRSVMKTRGRNWKRVLMKVLSHEILP